MKRWLLRSEKKTCPLCFSNIVELLYLKGNHGEEDNVTEAEDVAETDAVVNDDVNL